MKTTILTLIMLTTLSFLTSCGGSSSEGSQEPSAKQQEEQATKDLLSINKYEEDMKENGFAVFTKTFGALNNGVSETIITLNVFAESREELDIAKNYLEGYVVKVEKFLKDYSKDSFWVAAREDLELKLETSKDMIGQINDL